MTRNADVPPQADAPAPEGEARGGVGGELGLFGPASVTWRVQGDPLVLVGGIRALFLQAAHPRAMAGLTQNSDFRRDPWGRLMRTGEYVTTVAFGTAEEAERAASRVRGVHRRLRAEDPVTGRQFRLDEPDLLRWVHVSETESFVTTARRGGIRLDDAEVDRYYAEQREAARLVGLDPATVPSSSAEVAAYYEAMRPQLGVGREAREAAAFLFWPPMPPLVGLTAARPAWGGIVTLAFSLLPGWARRLYGLPGLPLADLPATLALRSLRRAVAMLPEAMTHGPIVRTARRRAAEALASSM